MRKTIKGVTYDTNKATYICSGYIGRGGWHGYGEAIARTKSGRYFVHRRYHLLDGRRLMPGDVPKAMMGGVWDDRRFVEHNELVPITRAQAVLRCLEFMIPQDLKSELRKLLRRKKNLSRRKYQGVIALP